MLEASRISVRIFLVKFSLNKKVYRGLLYAIVHLHTGATIAFLAKP